MVIPGLVACRLATAGLILVPAWLTRTASPTCLFTGCSLVATATRPAAVDNGGSGRWMRLKITHAYTRYANLAIIAVLAVLLACRKVEGDIDGYASSVVTHIAGIARIARRTTGLGLLTGDVESPARPGHT